MKTTPRRLMVRLTSVTEVGVMAAVEEAAASNNRGRVRISFLVSENGVVVLVAPFWVISLWEIRCLIEAVAVVVGIAVGLELM